jgi:hypothetical protein
MERFSAPTSPKQSPPTEEGDSRMNGSIVYTPEYIKKECERMNRRIKELKNQNTEFAHKDFNLQLSIVMYAAGLTEELKSKIMSEFSRRAQVVKKRNDEAKKAQIKEYKDAVAAQRMAERMAELLRASNLANEEGDVKA